jgi:hypothetical protein
MSQPAATIAHVDRVQRQSVIVGVAGLALCAIGGFFNPAQFFRSYLVAFLFWSGIPLGCLAVLMLHHLVGGGWGFLIRRLLEAGSRTMPLVALLFVPILLGIPHLYIWAHPEAVAADPLLLHKRVYLNVPFFVARAVAYFVIWIVLAHFLNRWSAEADDTGAASFTRRLYRLSGPGLVVYFLTMSFASLDWVMSIEPDWFSTIYSAVFMAGQVLSALAFVTAMLMLIASVEPLSEIVSPRYLNDLGNMLLTFVILWAYMAFSQFLIIWSGNLTDEIGWYLRRVRGGWQWVAAGVLAFHFGLPFLLLLSREIKRNLRSLSRLAAALLFIRLIDMVWNVDPAFDAARFRLHWMDWMASLGVGGIWTAAFLSQLKRRPLLPLHDPELPEILARAAEGAT